MHCAVVFSKSCLQLCIPFPLGSPPCWPCCEDEVYSSSCWARAAVAECSVCKQNRLSARTPVWHETCCPGKSCFWTIQVCPGALALSELQGSSIWMSFWLSWQSLSLKSCLHTAAFTDCSWVARTCRNRLGSCCTNIPTKQPCIVLAPQSPRPGRGSAQWFCFPE